MSWQSFFVENAKMVGEKMGVDLSSDPELFLRGTAYRPGNAPVLKNLSEYSTKGEADAICDSIRELLKKGYSEVDIAVIVYNKHVPYIKGWKTHYYNLLPYIKQIFYKENWFPRQVSQPARLIRLRRFSVLQALPCSV